MHLLYQTKYKIVIADDPDYSDDNEGLLDPETSQGSGSFTKQEIAQATNYLKSYYNRQMDALQEMDVVMEESEEEFDWTPPSSPIPMTFEINEDVNSDPIDEDDYKDLMTVLKDIVNTKPAFMNKPKPVFDLDIFKYVSFVAGTNDLILDLEYHVHEYPDDSDSTG